MQIDNNMPEVARRQIEYIAEVCERIKPLVVIRCATYNHEPFIRDALEGFVMQKTDFPFVALVFEDASTDGTAAVVREYAERYPDIILPIFEEENQYSKRDGSLHRITTAATEVTGAKYIALCEGDDYWTNENKLQKQVDFLENNKEYVYVFHNAIMHWEDNSYPDKYMATYSHGDISPLQLYAMWLVPTASVVFRRAILQSETYIKSSNIPNAVFGDVQIAIASGFHGKIYYLAECMSVYRKLATGMTAIFDGDPWPHIRTRFALSTKVYGSEYVKVDQKYASLYFIPALMHPFKHFPNNLILMLRLLWYAPIDSIKRIYGLVKYKIKRIWSLFK